MASLQKKSKSSIRQARIIAAIHPNGQINHSHPTSSAVYTAFLNLGGIFLRRTCRCTPAPAVIEHQNAASSLHYSILSLDVNKSRAPWWHLNALTGSRQG